MPMLNLNSRLKVLCCNLMLIFLLLYFWSPCLEATYLLKHNNVSQENKHLRSWIPIPCGNSTFLTKNMPNSLISINFDIQLHGLNTVSQLQINVYLNLSPMLCTALKNSWTSVFLIHERRKLMWNTPYLFLASIPLIKPEFWVIMFSQCIATGSERSVSLHISLCYFFKSGM